MIARHALGTVIGLGGMLVLALCVSAYAVLVYALAPLGSAVHPDMMANFQAHRLGIYAHVFAAAVALLLGPFQFMAPLRQRFPRVHRWSGRLYLGVGVLVGGMSGLSMAMHAFGGIVSRLGFACLALFWLYTGLRAFLAIRAGAVADHRRWMVRNFALTFAAVTLRIYLPASMAAGIPFELAYPAIAWLAWVPNLLIAEQVFNVRTARPGSRARPA